MTAASTSCFNSAIIDNIPVGIMGLGSDFTVTAWNNTMEKWTGIQRPDIIGRPASSFFPQLESCSGFELIEQLFRLESTLKTFSGSFSELFPSLKNPGITKMLHASLVPIQSGAARHILVTLEDRSELSQLNIKTEHLSIHTSLPHSKTDQLQLAASVFSNTSIGILVTDTRGIILSVNPAFEEITGYRETDAVGKTPRFLKSGIHDPTYYSDIYNRISIEAEWKGEIWVRRKNGEIFPQDTTITAIRDENGKVRQYSAILSDITERKKMEEQLRFLSMRDGMTGLFNRRTFDEEMNNEWRRALRTSTPFSLIILDIDYFKSYNDTYGHQQGDKCLKAVADVVKNSVHRKGDLTARYGGEEFVILLPSSSKNDALFIAECIRSNVAELRLPHKNSSIQKVVTASLGVGTLVPTLKNSPEKLFKLADKALYAAKSQGRNRVVSYAEEGRQLQLIA
jgi:diguanylate cyclase (GGDEF)-like protein/PAS domain S-box-containing protein